MRAQRLFVSLLFQVISPDLVSFLVNPSKYMNGLYLFVIMKDCCYTIVGERSSRFAASQIRCPCPMGARSKKEAPDVPFQKTLAVFVREQGLMAVAFLRERVAKAQFPCSILNRPGVTTGTRWAIQPPVHQTRASL